MGSTQGEIRVGPSHQAKLPENRLSLNALDSSPDPEFTKEREEVRWVPSVTLDGDLVMYLRAARSMAAFAGMCDGGSAEDGCIAARRDGTTINAMDVLHDCGYDPSKALQTLVKCPVPKSIEKKWTDEETKRFVKGLRQFGKNFFRIKKDLLPHKDTPELVEFYYLWKKTPGANNNRPHRRRRQGSLRRNRNTRNTRGGTPKEDASGNSSRPSPSSKDPGDPSSGSDDDNDNSYDDSDSRENGGYRCQHCFTTSSRDWLHATNGPKQGALLCYTCHTYYRQYGDLPPSSTAVSRNETYLFQPVQSESPEGSPGRMRTRNKAKETPTKEKSSKLKRSETTTPEPEGDKKYCGNSVTSATVVDSSKSPGSVLSSPIGDKSKKKVKSESAPNRKRSNILQNDGEIKRAKREHGPESPSGESDCESLLDEIDPSSPATAVNVNADEKSLKSDSMTSQSSLHSAATATAQPPLPPPSSPLPPPPPPVLSSSGGDLSRPVDSVEIKTESGESLLCPSATMFSSSSSPLSPETMRNSSDKKPDLEEETLNGASDDNKSFASADIEKNDQPSNATSFSFEQSSNACLKSENMYGYTSLADSKDEILPPILTSGEENYVPKDEMPTLHASTNGVLGGADANSESHYSTSSGYASQMEMPVVDSIKTEPGLQLNDETSASLSVDQAPNNTQRSNLAESSLTVPRHSSSSPPTMPATTFASLVPTSSPSSLLTYSSRVPSESPKPPSLDPSADRLSNVPPSLSAAAVLLPPTPYSVYQENERADKCLMAPTSANIPPPNAALSLAGSHHPGGAFPSYYHFSSPHPAHISDKSEHSPYLSANAALQMEPQNLKIKQEVVSLDQQRPPSVDPLQSLKEVKVPGYSNTSISQPLLPTSTTAALTSTLETHSMGGSGNRSDTNSPFLSNVSVDEIKKESDTYAPSSAATTARAAPLKSPNLATGVMGTTKAGNISGGDPMRSVSLSSSPPLSMKLSHTPPYSVGQPSHISQSSSSTSTRTPTSSPLNNTLTSSSSSSGTTTGSLISHANQSQLPPHSSSQPTLPPPPPPAPQSSPLQRTSPAHLAHPHAYMPSMHQHYFQHPLFAATAAAQVAHAMHHQYPHSPYSGYPYGFPYPAPYPIPQPIPPPRPMDSQKRDTDGGGSTTLLTSHHSSSLSSSVTTRSLRDDDSNVHSQEITQTHHHSSSHHSSIHHHNDKQTISHSSSSSSSASVQHKVKRSSSPQHSSSSSSSASCHVSATLSQSTSSSVSTNHGQSTHHSHHHQHTHHHQSSSAESPQLMNMPISLGGAGSGSRNGSSNAAQGAKVHPSSVLGGPPPSILPSAHHSALSLTGLPPTPAGSLEALRAHANAIHSPLLQSSHGLGHTGYLGPADMTLGNADLIKPDPSLLQSSDDSLLGVAAGAVEEDDILSPTNHIPKGPSPEPKIEDSECHRSQSAIFLRHWNRGDYNSCARTDLTFKPVPDSKLDKKRQERVRKQAEKEREEREKSQIRKIATPDKPETSKPPSRGPIETITSPYDRFARGAPYGGGAGAGGGGGGDTPALRQLSEYARPHAGFSPVGLPRSAAAAAASLALPHQCIDPMLHYQLNMYGPTPRERLELEHFEREKREREIRELREKELNDRLKEEMIKSAGSRLPNPLDSHWSDLRRYGALAPAAAAGNPGAAIHPFGLYAAVAGQPGALSPLERERFERLASTAGPFPRLSLLPGREAAIGLHHSPDLLARPYADQLAHQAVTHEHIQRQILLERERYHPALVAQQHDEYLRYQIGRS